LSNTATRSSTGTASDTVHSTKSTSARLAARSFQLANTPDAQKNFALIGLALGRL